MVDPVIIAFNVPVDTVTCSLQPSLVIMRIGFFILFGVMLWILEPMYRIFIYKLSSTGHMDAKYVSYWISMYKWMGVSLIAFLGILLIML